MPEISEKMLKQCAVTFATIGSTSDVIQFLQVDMLNYQKKTTMNHFCASNALMMNYLLDFRMTRDQTVTLGLDNSNLDNLNFNISRKEKKMVNFLSKTIFESNDPNINNSHCKYYSIDNFCSKNFDTNKYFSVLQIPLAETIKELDNFILKGVDLYDHTITIKLSRSHFYEICNNFLKKGLSLKLA